MTDQASELSEAIVLFLTHYPGKNDEEFRVRVDEATRVSVQAILDNESDALEHVLRKVRQGTKYHCSLQASGSAP